MNAGYVFVDNKFCHGLFFYEYREIRHDDSENGKFFCFYKKYMVWK
jgi:hypothetical protein